MEFINLPISYAFIIGTFTGRFCGIIPSILLSGALLFISDSSIYNHDSIDNIKKIIIYLGRNITMS